MSSKPRFRTIIIVIILIGLGIFYMMNDPMSSAFIPKCPFKWLTGYNCPGCGIQRFLHDFLTGHFLSAFHWNYFLVLLYPYLVVLVTVRYLMPVSTMRTSLQHYLEHRYIVYALIVLYFVWFVVRNIYGI